MYDFSYQLKGIIVFSEIDLMSGYYQWLFGKWVLSVSYWRPYLSYFIVDIDDLYMYDDEMKIMIKPLWSEVKVSIIILSILGRLLFLSILGIFRHNYDEVITMQKSTLSGTLWELEVKFVIKILNSKCEITLEIPRAKFILRREGCDTPCLN